MRMGRSKILKKGYKYKKDTVAKYYFDKPAFTVKSGSLLPPNVKYLTKIVEPNTLNFYEGKYGWAYICKETDVVLDASITIKFRGIKFHLELLNESNNKEENGFVLWCKTPDDKHAAYVQNEKVRSLLPVTNPKMRISDMMLYAVLGNPNVEYGIGHRLVRETALNMLRGD